MIQENIYGNSAIVFHRTSVEDLINKVYTEGWKPSIGGMYGDGFYATYDLESQLKKWMIETYGNIIVKFIVHNIEYFFIFEYDEFIKSPNYKKLNKPSKKDFIKRQIQHFKIKFKTFIDLTNLYSEKKISSEIAYLLYKNSDLRNKVKGIIFYGQHDGKVLVSYDSDNIVPVSYSIDEGKTFYKVPYNLEYLKKIVHKIGYFSTNDKLKPEYYMIKYFDIIAPNTYNIYQSVTFSNIKNSLPFKIKYMEGNLTFQSSFLTDLSNLPMNIDGNIIIDETCTVHSLNTLPDKMTIKGNFILNKCLEEKTISKLPNFSNKIVLLDSNIQNFDIKDKIQINDSLILKGNKLQSVQNLPQTKHLDISFNELTVLDVQLYNYEILNISNNKLKNLINCPEQVQILNASFNRLESLKGIPKYIHKDLIIESNYLKELDYLPDKINGSIYAKNNPFINVEKEIEKVEKKYNGKIKLII